VLYGDLQKKAGISFYGSMRFWRYDRQATEEEAQLRRETARQLCISSNPAKLSVKVI